MLRVRLCGLLIRLVMWIDPGFMPRIAIHITDRLNDGFKHKYAAERNHLAQSERESG